MKFCPVQKAIFIFVKLPKGRLHPTLPEMLKHEISESEYQIIIMTMIIIIIIRMAMMMFWRYADRCDWPNGGHFQLTADTSPPLTAARGSKQKLAKTKTNTKTMTMTMTMIKTFGKHLK